MLPQRPAGAPPPRPGRPAGSPPASPLGKPPGPPPGPPPGSPGKAALAKPPPRGPPPATASSSVVPSKPPSAPPPRAEEKSPAPPAATPAKKAPPPPRVGAPASPPPPDEKKGASDPAGRSSPSPPPGKPQAGPTRATPPGEKRPSPAGSPPSPIGAPPPRGPPPPARPPPGSPPPSSGAPPPRGPPPRGPPPRGPPPRGPPPRAPPAGAPPPRGPPPGPPPGAPPGKAPSAPPAARAPTAGTPPEQQENAAGAAAVGGQSRVAGGENDRSGGEALAAAVTVEQSASAPGGAAVGGEAGGGGKPAGAAGQDRGVASPPSVKRQKVPPSSPKAPPGVPAGMAPPRSPPPGAGRQPATAMAVDTKTSTEGAEGEEKRDSPGASASATPTKARTSPPGDPGRRRPPPGAPPGRKPPTIAPPSARPAPPSVEDLAIVKAKEEEPPIIVADDDEDEDVPPPPEGLPPPDGLSDDDDDDEDGDGEAEGLMVKADEDDLASPRDPKELEVLRRGRFIVRCIEGGDVRKSVLSNRTPTVDAYIRVTLGKHKKAPSKKTKVVKRSGVNPNFESEKLVFDIVEPDEFIVGGDVSLTIEIWDDSAWADDLLASVQLSALRFMRPDLVPTAEWFPLEAPSGRIKDRMKVQVEISFEPALLGMFVLTLYEGRGLGENDAASRPNPYVVASLGDMYQKRSRAAKGGGSSPVFRQEEIILWIDKENWTNDLQLQVRSEDIGTDAELGSAKISVLQAMGISPDQATERKIELVLDGQPAGQLFAKSTFLPAGKLSFVCEGGRGLRETSAAGRMDPYVIFKADGKAVSLTRKTKVDKDGGTDPRWNETVEIDIVDQYTLWLECFNHDVLDSDELIGSAQCSLLPVFKRGTLDTWIQLNTSSGPGPPKPAGEIHCIFSFEGPSGVAYPQHQPGVDSFDDSLRVNLRKYLEEANDEGKNGGLQPEDGAASTSHQDRPALQRSTEFTDEEIAAAFKFLDLDHNLHIGAAEIRHILICMGELITDEEVDMMISMVDSDGDGQVSFEEFHRLVIDPDPSRADFGIEPIKSNAQEAAQVTQEMKDRETKRWLLGDFVKENEIRAVEIEMAYKRFKNLAPSSGGKQATSPVEMDFKTWILVFNVEATGQYRKLFKLYALPGTDDETDTDMEAQKVDIRDFFLGMANFVEWALEPRTQFIFTLFDNDRSGFLSMDELVDVLKANHLTTAKAVAKKAQTIMKQADADGSGTLTMDEFLVVAKKFPNLLFPAKPKETEAKAPVPMIGNG